MTANADSSRRNLYVGVDIGGTFTDLVAVDRRTGEVFSSKCLTTPQNFADGVWDCFAKAGLRPAEMSTITHGSTIAINITIEQTGARTGLIVTSGTRDVYEIGRQNRPEAYNFAFTRPRPLTARSMILEIRERMDARGNVVRALHPEDIRAAATRLANEGAEAVAVCFLHSYNNPAHEIEAGRLLAELLPDEYLSLSHQIIREYREYERISTTVLNCYVGPKTSTYIANIERRLADEAFSGSLLIMQSNGGVVSAAAAKRTPVLMMESGPASGAMASAEVGRRLGYRDLIAFDMGGTTAKSALIKGGAPEITQGYYIGGYANGHPVTMPVVDIVEVGAGGGSIAWIDEVGALKVGPRSASADPGPVCYSRGGTEPTVTDANVVLGRIDHRRFLGGDMVLDVDAARDAITHRIAEPLELGTVEAALGILRIATAKMSLSVRQVSVERGHDPRGFAMTALGGAGPLHALDIARDLHIPTVIVPQFPAQFCALGMLMTDIRHDDVRTHLRPLAPADLRRVATVFEELVDDGMRRLEEHGVEPAARRLQRWLDLRYVGQEFTLQTPVTAEQVIDGQVSAITESFEHLYSGRYGHAAPEEPLEIVNLRLTAIGERPKPQFPELERSDSTATPHSSRDIHLSDPEVAVVCAVYRRDDLRAGEELSGPAVIEEYASTTVAAAGDRVRVAVSGELVIEVARES